MFQNENPHCDHCGPEVHEKHTTEEHDENWVNNADPCEECGAGEHQACKPTCSSWNM